MTAPNLIDDASIASLAAMWQDAADAAAGDSNDREIEALTDFAEALVGTLAELGVEIPTPTDPYDDEEN